MFLFLSLGFWILTAFAAIVMTIVIELDGRGQLWTTFLTLLVFLGLVYLSNRTTAHEIVSNLQISDLKYVGYSLLIGLVWSFFKWLKLVKEKYQDFKETAYSRFNQSDEQSEEKTKRWMEEHREKYIPKPAKYKNDISSWIIFWPFSMIRYFLNDLLNDFVNLLIRKFNGVYKYIANSQFK